MVIDLGTGDGRFVLAEAAADPGLLAVGIDAAAASMAESSHRAARAPRRGGLPNALFVAAAAEALPAELDGLADVMTVHFPWGSLLRGLLCADPTILAGLARLTRPGATLHLLLSVTERDHVAGMTSLDARLVERLARGYAAHGFTLVERRQAAPDDIAAAHSTWAKRLGAGAARAAWLLRFRRCETGASM